MESTLIVALKTFRHGRIAKVPTLDDLCRQSFFKDNELATSKHLLPVLKCITKHGVHVCW